jgi:transcriptional regulator with GAF, ATPase, and Fis domain
LIDHHSIGRLLLETGSITKADYAVCSREAKAAGKSPHEILLKNGKVTVDELVEAITIHLDITLLKEALGMDSRADQFKGTGRPLGSYLERISLLFKTGVLMTGQKTVSSLLELLLREAPSVMNAERATIFLPDYGRKELYSHVGVGVEHGQIRIPWASGIAGWVFTSGESLRIPDPYNDSRFNRDVDLQTGYTTRNLLCVPLRSPGGTISGVFEVLNKRAGVFTSTDLEILEILASQACRSIENALEWDDLWKRASRRGSDNRGAGGAAERSDPMDAIIGNSPAIQKIGTLIRQVAPTETTILIQGESGTGKELVAEAIHRFSRRSGGPMITLNCAAVPAELIESELFGHKKGAFTGAVRDHQGVFRAAHMGTLFLDEIEATSPAMQVKLLRAIQLGEIKPVGENTSRTVDVRLVTATNQDLGPLMDQGSFREDLFYRINVFPIRLPPLRDRAEDIPILVHHFLDKLSRTTGKLVRGIDPAAMDLLVRYPWPGNVRELENETERAHVLTGAGTSISVGCLSPRITRSLGEMIEVGFPSEPKSLKEAVEQLELRMIQEALEGCGGNRTAAARRLGLSRQGLLNKMYKFELI